MNKNAAKTQMAQRNKKPLICALEHQNKTTNLEDEDEHFNQCDCFNRMKSLIIISETAIV